MVIKTKIYNYKFYVYSSSKFKFQLFKAFKNLSDFVKIGKGSDKNTSDFHCFFLWTLEREINSTKH